ncbi:hypothetical protein CVT26_002527 [Gymnopilus dilepis]|uniref:Uncharacterized protein n=1 Tax=Gymnopilus dilepis TaxID=231916 RepID=A0A409VSX7_9AGAR|nr:hypothetical protein CVT26_002527 [Gymnopilus dilepis]
MSVTTNTHPNAGLHSKLVKAVKEHKLDAEFLKKELNLGATPRVERNSSAYVNWNTTLSLLDCAPARVFFAGVSTVGGDGPSAAPAPARDRLRDDLSVGVYYWCVERNPPKKSYFWVDVFSDSNELYIEVWSEHGNLEALFVGTATMNVQIQGGTHWFEGEGLWGYADANKGF